VSSFSKNVMPFVQATGLSNCVICDDLEWPWRVSWAISNGCYM